MGHQGKKLRVLATLLAVSWAWAVSAQTPSQEAAWPKVGDRWIYEASEATRPQKRYQITVDVVAVNASSIRDSYRWNDDVQEVVHQAAPTLEGISPGVASFMSYYPAFRELRVGESWRSIAIERLGQCTSTSFYCNAAARVVSKEKVTVRAGTFDAWKIVVDMSIVSTLRGAGRYEFWYAEEIKRVVKIRSRVRYEAITTAWKDPDMDVELISYSPAQ
jgi:hypothetical protein